MHAMSGDSPYGGPMEDTVSKTPMKEYPQFTVLLKDFPQAREWKVGGKYYIMAEVVQTELEEKESVTNGKPRSLGTARFSIRAIGAMEGGEKRATLKGKQMTSDGYIPEAPAH